MRVDLRSDGVSAGGGVAINGEEEGRDKPGVCSLVGDILIGGSSLVDGSLVDGSLVEDVGAVGTTIETGEGLLVGDGSAWEEGPTTLIGGEMGCTTDGLVCGVINGSVKVES
jgi:hypothetical protein